MRRGLLFLTIALGLGAGSVQAQELPWRAGAARVSITPPKLMWMSGYAGRDKPAEGKVHDLWAKALVLQDAAGQKLVLVSLDLVGIPRDLSVDICQELEKKYQLPRASIVLACSHTHCGPVVRKNLGTMYFLDDEQKNLVLSYGQYLPKRVVLAVGEALENLRPASVAWGIGEATFAVNRRNNKEAEVPKLREAGMLKGPVDHDVPVLAVRDAEKRLIAAAFGYACHATVLSFYQWCGDYPGFAMLGVEKNNPGAVALFWAGCGGDQNPLPRRTVALAQNYGGQLAEAVQRVLDRPMKELPARLETQYREIPLALAELPSREGLVKDTLDKNKYIAARGRWLLAKLDKGEALAQNYPYPVQVFRLGESLNWVTLGGEVTVDYALRLKKEIEPGKTWVMGYANDVMAYIPSLRVLKEGGYEGASSMIYYGLPTVWSPRIEESIVAAVREEVAKSK